MRAVVRILPLSPKRITRLVSMEREGVSCLIVSTSRVPSMSPQRASAAYGLPVDRLANFNAVDG